MESSLEKIERSLRDNPAITVAKMKDDLPWYSNFWKVHVVDFYVIPKTERLREDEELDAMLLSLITSVEPDSIHRHWKDEGILGAISRTGILCFKEEIGTESSSMNIEFSDPTMTKRYPNCQDCVGNKIVTSNQGIITRMINVILCDGGLTADYAFKNRRSW